VPPQTKVALALLLAACIARAVFGAPPARRHDHLAPASAALGIVLYALAAIFAIAALAAAGSLSLCLAVWLARGRDDGWGRGGDDPPEPPVDWEAFDRERARWRPRPREWVA
jgi:hypothetical protein